MRAARPLLRSACATLLMALLLIAVLLCGPACSTPRCRLSLEGPRCVPDSDGRLPAEAWRQEFDLLVCAVRTFHPARTLFTPAADLDTLWSQLRDEINQPRTTLQFFDVVTRAIVPIADRHTVARLPPDGDGRQLPPSAARRYLPLSVIIDGSRGYVLRCADSAAIPPGSELLALDDRPWADVRTTLRARETIDGRAVAALDAHLERNFRRLYFEHVSQARQTQVEFRRPGHAAPERAVLSARTLPELQSAGLAYGGGADAVAGAPAATDAIFQLDWLPPRAAWLTLRTFESDAYRAAGGSEERVYDPIFEQLRERGVERLLLDLRGNPGGRTEYVRELLSYLLPRARLAVLYRVTSFDGVRRTYWLPPSEREAFRGRLFLLVDAGTQSAAAHLAGLLRRHAGAVILGEETGSRADGASAGTFERLILPHSRIEVEIPRWRYDLPAPRDAAGRGVVPDVELRPALADRLAGRDGQRAAAIEYMLR